MKSNHNAFTETYLDTGSGHAVIILPGLFGNPGIWGSVISTLESHYHVIIPRLPLFDLPARNTNIEYIARVLNEFIKWHQLAPVTLIGHALGGQIAMKYTHLFPNTVRSMVLTGCSGLSSSSIHHGEDDYDNVHKKVKEIFYDGSRITHAMVDEVYDTIHNSSKRLAVMSLVQSSNVNNITSSLHKIDQPVLLIWGLQDKVTPPEAGIHLHDTLPHAEINFIDHCGHLPMIEHADLFNQNLVSFLKRLD